MTVLGDLAQATAPGAQESWEAAIAHLGGPATAQRADLDLGYRVPASIMDDGQRAAGRGGARRDAVPVGAGSTAGSRRSSRSRPTGEGTAVAEAVGGLAGRVLERRRDRPPDLAGDVDAAVAALPADRRARLTVLDPPDAKGLEFDAVVVVEPAAIAGDSARGLRLLYVALTRAVQELVVVHADPLPEGLAA